ncbi:MAG: DUF1992 domain-containing protein [bacterium]
MTALNWIAENRIKQAIESGEFDNIPGQGKPIPLQKEFDRNTETRICYTILKNAGFLPVPLLIRKEIETELYKTRNRAITKSNVYFRITFN